MNAAQSKKQGNTANKPGEVFEQIPPRRMFYLLLVSIIRTVWLFD
jgi:hypothetical protein